MNIPKADAESFFELTPTKAKELGILWEDWRISVFCWEILGFQRSEMLQTHREKGAMLCCPFVVAE
jgi:hypothetical protein